VWGYEARRGLAHKMHAILFKLGPITIYTYGLFLFLGVILGYSVCSREAKRQNIEGNVFSNIFFQTIICGFIGARIFYIFIEGKYFLEDPIGVLLGRSGFVFYGGVVFGLSCLYILARKYKIKFLKLADIFILGTVLAHSLGRLGCFFYGCCYGKSTDSFLGVLFPPSSPAGFSGHRVIPTQIISAFFLFLLFWALFLLRKKKRFDGQIFLGGVISYGIFRFIIEFFRGDPRGQIFYLSTSQLISLILVVLGAALLLREQLLSNRSPKSLADKGLGARRPLI